MAWEKLTPHQPRIAGLTVRITEHGYGGKPYLVIRISRELAQETLIDPDKNSRIDVFVGAGADAGSMRIAPDKNGAYAIHPQGKRGALKLALPAPRGAPAEFEPHKGYAVDAILDDGAIVFHAPWYKPAGERRAVSDFVAENQRLDREYAPRTAQPETATTLDAVQESAGPWAPGLSLSPPPPPPPPVLDDEDDKPVNGSAHGHVYPDSAAPSLLAFVHKGKSCQLNRKQHAAVLKLHAAMLKCPDGHLDFDTLIKVAGATDRAVMQATLSAARKAIEPLGLKIISVPGFGYRMEESA